MNRHLFLSFAEDCAMNLISLFLLPMQKAPNDLRE